MNQVFFVGRLVKDIEVKVVKNDLSVVSNTLAINRWTKNKDGQSITDFIPIVAWGNQANVLAKYCQKGQRIAIAGKMQSRNYTANDQTKRYVIECVVHEITLLDRLQQVSVPQFDESESDTSMIDELSV